MPSRGFSFQLVVERTTPRRIGVVGVEGRGRKLMELLMGEREASQSMAESGRGAVLLAVGESSASAVRRIRRKEMWRRWRGERIVGCGEERHQQLTMVR